MGRSDLNGLHCITLENASLSLHISITRGGDVRLKQVRVINNAISNLFKYYTPQQTNSLPLNIAQCSNLMSFKHKHYFSWIHLFRVK